MSGQGDSGMRDRHKPQRRNRFSFEVTWPAEMPADHPAAELAGQTYRACYPTREAMELAARGFEMEGATVR
jgi:hypothetical protein